LLTGDLTNYTAHLNEVLLKLPQGRVTLL